MVRSAKPASSFERLPCPLVIKRSAETILEDEKYKVLREFTSIYGIGPVTAQTLYTRGCRSLENVRKFYEDPDNTPEPDSDDPDDEYEDQNKHVPERWIHVSLALKDDLSIK
jgi:predicted flap endonuclease-1-like 5' DNA nuclease